MDAPLKTPDFTQDATGAFHAAHGSAFVFSAHVGDNDKCFAQLMALHVPDGATVADVTYGRGNFWKCVPHEKYDVKATDLADGVDCRNLPYGDATIDAVVLDPHNGSGTTTEAAHLLGRQFIGVDVNPEYCRIAEARAMRPNAQDQP